MNTRSNSRRFGRHVRQHKLWAMVTILATALAALGVQDGEPTIASTDGLREISYYPRYHAWLKFWPEWEETRVEMDADLDRIRELGANTVRIFVHPDEFNYPNPPTEAQRERFEEALGLIAQRDLRAHVNLFDCWWRWDEIEASRAWMEAFVTPYAGDTRIALWELQNEVDLENPVVRTWVGALLPELRLYGASTPCTVSLLDVEQLDDLEALAAPDLYSLHWYPSSDVTWTSTLVPTLQRAVALVGADKLLLGEFGYDSHRVSEAVQAALYRDVLYAARQQGIAHVGQWTLNDFPAGTAQCDPGTPATEPELHFGVYRLDGTAKPARETLYRVYHGRPPASPSPPRVYNGSFEESGPPCGAADWYPWDPTWTGECAFARDCSVAHTGSCSARFDEMPDRTVGTYNVPALPVEGGARYSLEGYARAEGLEGEAWIALSCFDAEENWLGDVRSASLTGAHGTGWTRLRIDPAMLPAAAVLPGEAVYCQVYAQFYSSNPDTVVWFDDLTTMVERGYLPVVMR